VCTHRPALPHRACRGINRQPSILIESVEEVDILDWRDFVHNYFDLP
jgi:hypothetical protein